MIIEKVNNINDAKKCNELLTKLLISESKYDKNLRNDYIITNYFENKYQNEDNILLIAKQEENVIGYAYCKINELPGGPIISKVTLLDGIFVEEKYRKQTIATKLINECKNWSKEIGATYFEIKVAKENINALKIYEQIGFKDFEHKMRIQL